MSKNIKFVVPTENKHSERYIHLILKSVMGGDVFLYVIVSKQSKYVFKCE